MTKKRNLYSKALAMHGFAHLLMCSNNSILSAYHIFMYEYMCIVHLHFMNKDG